MAEIDIGQITEALNDKMDRDAGNPEPVGKKTIVGWGLPDYTAGVSVSSGYTATAKSWLYAHTSGNGGSGTAGNAFIYVNGTQVVASWVSSWNYQTINDVVVPLDVGDVVTASASLGTASMVVFPMKGV